MKDIVSKLIFSFCILVILALTLNGCYESLPLREDPKEILSASLTANYAAHVSLTTMTITLNVENKFDETLQDHAFLDGVLTIQWLGDPQSRKTIKLSKLNLQNNGQYNPSTGILTIDPHEVLQFVYVWDFTDDNGDSIPQEFKTYLSPHCLEVGEQIFVARESFLIEGSMNVFSHTGFTRAASITYSCCYAFGISRSCSRPSCD
ncbi:MAG: hypothetical protein Q8L88_13495 [Bacteroidota bacterium]|nr:hypothetical protein [Bacteroidota bacterium]